MQISNRVHALRVPFSLITAGGAAMDRFAYLYLIYGTEICLINTGVASSAELIFDYVRKTDRKVSDIALVIQTDSHPDHIGATRLIKAETGCSVAIHPAERTWLEDVDLQAEERPIQGFHDLVSGSVAVNRALGDNEIVDLGCGLKLQVLHTPGHSRGSISLLLLGYMLLFSGGAVPVPDDLPFYEDVSASVQSIKRLKGIPDIRQLLATRDEPQKGGDVYGRMDEGLQYLQRVHEAVLKASGNDPSPELMELSGKVLDQLGMPSVLASPFTARSVASYLLLRRQGRII